MPFQYNATYLVHGYDIAMKLNNLRNPEPPVRIGISSCLLGEKVRYDGGHKKNQYIIEQLSPLFELVPYCPEVAVGMGVPRPAVQLVDCNGEIHALGIENPDTDMSKPLREYGKKMAGSACVSGYIFKRNSPSCGINKVKVLVGNDQFELRGQGLFAAEIMQQLPDLPVIDEQLFMDENLRKHFLINVSHYFQTHNQ